MDSLLKRQIRRHWGDPDALPAEWQALLSAVDQAYAQHRADQALLQRSMELMSEELTERNRALQEQLRERTATEQALRESEARLAKTHQVAKIGNWMWDIQADHVTWSREVFSMFGLHPVTFVPSKDGYMDFVHPDDRAIVTAAIDRSLATGAPYNLDHRVMLPDGSVRFVNEQGELEYDGDGQPVRMFGTMHDITSRKLVEAHQGRIWGENGATGGAIFHVCLPGTKATKAVGNKESRGR